MVPLWLETAAPCPLIPHAGLVFVFKLVFVLNWQGFPKLQWIVSAESRACMRWACVLPRGQGAWGWGLQVCAGRNVGQAGKVPWGQPSKAKDTGRARHVTSAQVVPFLCAQGGTRELAKCYKSKFYQERRSYAQAEAAVKSTAYPKSVSGSTAGHALQFSGPGPTVHPSLRCSWGPSHPGHIFKGS